MCVCVCVDVLQMFPARWTSKQIQRCNSNKEAESYILQVAKFILAFGPYIPKVVIPKYVLFACWASSTVKQTGQHRTPSVCVCLLLLWLVTFRRHAKRRDKLYARTVCSYWSSCFGRGSPNLMSCVYCTSCINAIRTACMLICSNTSWCWYRLCHRF